MYIHLNRPIREKNALEGSFDLEACDERRRQSGYVLACVGDVPTLETVAASWLLQKHLPGIRVRVVNIVGPSL
jgi:phosphoketolase